MMFKKRNSFNFDQNTKVLHAYDFNLSRIAAGAS